MAFTIEKYRFRKDPLLEGLPLHESRLLKEKTLRLEFRKNKLLFREGSYSKGVYILRKGKVKIFQLSKEGKEQIAYIYRRGEIMGYRPLLCESPHPVSAMALDDCVVSFIPKKEFLQALDQSAILSRRILVNLAHEFSVWIHKMSALAQQPVQQRVALVLLILNEKYRKEGREDEPTTINLSREDIANYVRTSIETLVRMLRKLKDEKIIKTEGRKIIVLHPKKLEKIADTD